MSIYQELESQKNKNPINPVEEFLKKTEKNEGDKSRSEG